MIEDPDELQLVIDENNHRLQSLAAQGVVVPDLSLMRLSVLLEVLLGDALPAAELHFQRRMAQALDGLASQVNRAKLTHP